MNNENILLSIIIPTYNSRKTIINTIESIKKNIDDLKYEILIIDDLSSDGTIDIIKKYDTNIKILNKNEKRGVSSSRNVGIKESNGRYVTFVDSDDFIINNIFSKISSFLQENYDIIAFNYKELNNNKISYSKYDYTSLNSDYFNEFLSDKISMSVWDKIYKKSFLTKNNIKFNVDIKYSEDVLFNIEAFSRTKNVKLINEYGYLYVQNNCSAMHNYSPCMIQIATIDKYINSSSLNNIMKNNINYFEIFTLIEKFKYIHAVIRCLNKKNKKEIRKSIISIINDIETNNYKNLTKTNKIEIFIIKYFGLKVYVLIYNFYNLIRKRG